MGSIGLGENSASVAFLSKLALGLRFVPRAQFPCANAASTSDIGAIFEIGPLWVPAKVPKVDLLGPV